MICQTLVRVCGIPHAETNAAILPEAMAFMRRPGPRAGRPTSPRRSGPSSRRSPQRIRELGRPPGLGASWAPTAAELDEALEAMLERPELGFTSRTRPSRHAGDRRAELVERRLVQPA